LGPRLEAVAQLKDLRLASVVPWDFEGSASGAKKEPSAEPGKWALRADVPINEILAQKQPGNYTRRMRVHKSYSALKHAKRIYGEQRLGVKEDEAGATSVAGLEVLDFPAGAEAGTVLHALFENIDFKTVYDCESSEALAARPEFLKLLENDDAKALLKGEAKYIQAAAGMVWRTLHAEWDGSGFTLGALEKADRICELEFTFPLPTQESGASQDGFLNGFIDLVYRRDIDGVEKYFVLDWKSDALPAYDAATLRRHMDAMEYSLQYKVYALAMTRWLKQCGLDPREAFGGIQYVFLRGVGRGTRDGIFVQGAPADLSAWEREIFARLNEPAWAAMEERGR
jgi:exodeoxyribonuclease V beta subunit